MLVWGGYLHPEHLHSLSATSHYPRLHVFGPPLPQFGLLLSPVMISHKDMYIPSLCVLSRSLGDLMDLFSDLNGIGLCVFIRQIWQSDKRLLIFNKSYIILFFLVILGEKCCSLYLLRHISKRKESKLVHTVPVKHVLVELNEKMCPNI